MPRLRRRHGLVRRPAGGRDLDRDHAGLQIPGASYYVPLVAGGVLIAFSPWNGSCASLASIGDHVPNAVDEPHLVAVKD